MPPGGRRFGSLGVRLATTTLLVLALMSLLLYSALASRELERLVAAKVSAGNMLADLAAEGLSAPLEFADDEAIGVEIAHLRQNPEITFVGVWSEGPPPAAAGHDKADAPRATYGNALGAGSPRERAQEVLASRIVLDRRVVDRSGARVGALRLELTLEPEIQAHRLARGRLLFLTLLLGVGTGAALLVMARRMIISPLSRLASAARRIGRGDLTARTRITRDDEIGDLASTFDKMAESLSDRESKLAAATQELRDLFDHMRQAILAFDASGTVVGATSRQADQLFGAPLAGRAVRGVLFPDAPAYDVGAMAFDEWVSLAFDTPLERWDEHVTLAPREVVVPVNGVRTPLDVEFRPVLQDGVVVEIMLLATDVSEKRLLERAVEDKEAEYARRLAAMRRMLAGGSQVFVAFVDGARRRLAHCRARIRTCGARLATDAVDELFRNIHTVRGEARAFDLVELEREATKLEEELDELRSLARGDAFEMTEDVRDRLLGRVGAAAQALDRGCEMFAAASPLGHAIFDQVTVQRSALTDVLSRIDPRDSALQNLAVRVLWRPFGESAAGILEAAPAWAEAEAKRVRLAVEGREILVPEALGRVLPGALVHLVRNAIAHGIESPEDRRAAGKPVEGTVLVAARQTGSATAFVVEDDGRGLDIERILAVARAAGREAAAREVPELIFEAGLSTRREVDGLAGRGFGLNAARAELRQVGYDVAVFTEAGRFTRFVLSPAESNERSSSNRENDVVG